VLIPLVRGQLTERFGPRTSLDMRGLMLAGTGFSA